MRKLLAFVLVVLSFAGCDAFGRSKMARGELYQSGDGRWDPYFVAVHEQQVSAGTWQDDKKAARKSLVKALDVAPSASDDTLVDATRGRVTKAGSADGTLSSAVEETKRAELDRAAHLKAAALRFDDLTKQGKAYEEEAKREYENRGAMKADDKKSDKMNEVRRELDGAVDACSSLSRDAKKGAKEAQDFVDDLTAAVNGKDAPKHRDSDKKDEKKTEEKKDEPKPEAPPPPAPPTPPKAKPKQPPPPPPPPAAKPPAEKPKAPDEVFNP